MENLRLAKNLGNWGPFGRGENRVAVFTVGNPCEGHGPALPKDIDDRVVKALALRACDAEGAYYCGHVPFTSDRVGRIALAWSPLWIPEDEMVSRTGQFIKTYLAMVGLRFHRICLLNGHGGNNFIAGCRRELSRKAGRSIDFVIPFEGIETGHADTLEHSVAAYLGLVDAGKLAAMNDLVHRDPKKALRRWPPTGGLGGYIMFGGEEFSELQKPEYGLTKCLEGFLADREIRADMALGRNLFDGMLAATCKALKH